MTDKEIYLLNLALDGREIYGLKKSFLSKMNICSLKDKLIIKGILDNRSSFSERGLAIVSKLKRYKESEIYATIGNVIIGLKNGRDGIALIYNKFIGTYRFEKIDIKNIYQDIEREYKFLTYKFGIYKEESYCIDKDYFEKEYSITSKDRLFLEISGENSNTCEMFFVKDNELYVYDYNENILRKLLKVNVIKILKERLDVIEGNKV